MTKPAQHCGLSRTVLSAEDWLTRRKHHRTRVEELTADHLERRSKGQRHPVWDFMFNYYPVTPGQLKHWHPGLNCAIEIPDEETKLPHYKDHYRQEGSLWALDLEAFMNKRGSTVFFVHRLLQATAKRPPQLNCFGLHEWAMVYRTTPRHPEPLRLGAAGTDELVEASNLKCTHYDAFRFFTKDAAPRNEQQITREMQPELDQPGCLHASMDLYKWATKLGPLIPGELWLKTFELACQLRELDMRASPYDLSDWGFSPVKIETPAGRADYVRLQKALTEKGQALRHEILDILQVAVATTSPETSGTALH